MEKDGVLYPIEIKAATTAKPRDKWIGWSDEQRRRRLNLLASNSRFLLLRKPGEYPNMATKIMKLSTKRLNEDWQNIHKQGLLTALIPAL